MDWRDIPSEKFIDCRAIASQFQARLCRANSAMRTQLGAAPRIVELAYNDQEHYARFGFGRIFAEVVQQVLGEAGNTGITYEYDKFIREDTKTLSHVRDRLSALAADPAVDGVKVSGWGLMLPSDDVGLDWIDPRKDIACYAVESYAWLKDRQESAQSGRGVANWWMEGQGPLIHPFVGAALIALNHGLKGKPLSQMSVALIQHRSEGPYDDYLLNLLAAAFRGSALTIYTDPGPQDAHRLHEADAIITGVEKPSYLDSRYVRQGQVIIDFGGKYHIGGDVDLDTVIPVIAAYAKGAIVSNLQLTIEFLNAMRSFLLKQKEDVAHFYPLLEVLEQN